MKNYTHKYIARFVLEAKSPFAVFSGKTGLNADKLFIRDVNGLPFIPGTSLAGVLRHNLQQRSEVDLGTIFGSGGADGEGSRFRTSAAFLVTQNGQKVIEGFEDIPHSSSYYDAFRLGVNRDHVKITHRGVGDDGHKFEEELVPIGARFCFELELDGTSEDQTFWNTMLQFVYSSEFRVGAGSRKGFGVLEPVVEECFQIVLDLISNTQLDAYLDKSSSLNAPFSLFKKIEISRKGNSSQWTTYQLSLTAKDFYIFGAGYGDDEVDKVTKTEYQIEWDANGGKVKAKKNILIPGTSIKGALAHRVAYHYNLTVGNTIEKGFEGAKSVEKNDSIHQIIQHLEGEFEKEISKEGLEQNGMFQSEEEIKNVREKVEKARQNLEKTIQKLISTDPTMDDKWLMHTKSIEDEALQNSRKEKTGSDDFNLAVITLFGIAKNSEIGEVGQRGKVMIPDVIRPYEDANQKIFQHVKIDRFTGGAIDSALFNEKGYQDKGTFSLEIQVETSAFKDPHIKEAWETALEDLISGKLPLGGLTNKGYGAFTGSKKIKS